MTLTKAQHAALLDLRRYGALVPNSREHNRRSYAARTLESLALYGYGVWRSDGTLVPVGKQEPVRFVTSYLDQPVFNLPDVIETCKAGLAGVDFDTMVGTGFSGGLVIPALAMAMGKHFVLIRKETDDSHHGGGRLLGELGNRWIFVDDFVSSGATRRRVLDKITTAIRVRGNTHAAEYVGDFMYSNGRFTPAAGAGYAMAGLLDGDPLLAVRGDNAKECWRVIEPVLDAWHADEVPMDTYAAGSDGPRSWT